MTTATTTATATIDRLLDAIAAGTGVPDDLFAPTATLDATVPGWRFSVHGAGPVARKYSAWFADEAVFEELERLSVEDGEVVTYLLTWTEKGVPHAAHHCHRLRCDELGRIAADRFFCGGRWNAALLADMAAAEHAG